MLQAFQNFLAYIKHPVLEKDTNTSVKYRFKIMFQILTIDFALSFLIVPLFLVFEWLGWIDLDGHKLEEVFKGMPLVQVLLLGGLIVPIIEELFFRAPITLFTQPKTFRIAFYFFAFAFGFIHITNFELTTVVLLLSPILVLPQIFGGLVLGYLRVRFGLLWSILAHCIFNTVLFSTSFLEKL